MDPECEDIQKLDRQEACRKISGRYIDRLRTKLVHVYHMLLVARANISIMVIILIV